MAKNKSKLIRLEGVLGDLHFIHNRVYGYYVRMPRGSKKKAVLNEACEHSRSRTALLNQVAQPVHRALKEISGPFKGSQLWQEMLSCLRKTTSNLLAELLGSLEGLELNKDYPLRRLVPVLSVEAQVREEELLVDLRSSKHPVFQKKVGADSYYYEIFVLWMDEEGDVCEVSSEQTEWAPMKNGVQGYEFRFKLPETAKYYLICLGIEAGSKRKKIELIGGKGMRVVKVGSLFE